MKTHIRWIVPILLSGFLILTACQPVPQAAETPPVVDEIQEEMPDVPPIDRDQPDEFATATFSMG